MEYIKNPMMIEEKSFIMIQEIIDEIRPGYKFKNEIEEIMHEIDENNDIMSREEVEQVKVNTMINRFSAENKQQAQRFIGAIKNNLISLNLT